MNERTALLMVKPTWPNRAPSKSSTLLAMVARRVHFPEHEGMAADGALAKDDQRAGEDVGALDGDRHRNHLVAASEIVARAQLDALAAMHVHGVVRDLPAHLRDVVLEHRGRHRGLFAAVDGAGRDRTRRIHGVGVADHARQHGLDAFEFAHRHVELAPDAGVGARGEHAGLGAAGGVGGQRDATADRELLDQHAPALSGHLRAADDEVERHEHVLAGKRAVLERHVEREVAPADGDAGRVARDQRAGDAEIGLVAQQLVGIEHAEREADDGRDRRERDVALVEVELQADDLAALPHGRGRRCRCRAAPRRRSRRAAR